MRKLILTILALLALVPAFAQTRKVSGVVRDDNGETLPGAIVVVKSGGAKGNVAGSATTDDKGRYTIECKDNDYLSVHFLGFEEST